MSKIYSNKHLEDIVKNRLIQSEFWTDKTRENNKTIQNLVCPACGDKSAWAYVDSPMSINCNKLSSCGARTKTLELFHIRQDIEKEFKSTKEDPHRPARAYLQSRGINKMLSGLVYEYWKNVRKTGSGAVMFPVGKNKNWKRVLNGRLFNPRRQDGKTHNSGSTTGLFWQHPGYEYNPEKPTFITEGIIDALSFLEMGRQAIAVLSAGQDPAKLNLSFFNNLIPAFDNDNAGKRATKQWIKYIQQ